MVAEVTAMSGVEPSTGFDTFVTTRAKALWGRPGSGVTALLKDPIR